MIHLNVNHVQKCKKHLCCNLFWVPTQFDWTNIKSNLDFGCGKVAVKFLQYNFVAIRGSINKFVDNCDNFVITWNFDFIFQSCLKQSICN